MPAEIVTSENLAEFNATRLRIPVEPVQDAKVIKETPKAEDPPATAAADPKAVEEAEDPPAKPKGNPKIQERFSELTARAKAAEERAEAAERKAREAEAKTAPKPVEPIADPDIGPEPKAEDYANDPFKFARDLAKWTTEKALKDRDANERKAAQQREAAKVQDAWTRRVEAVKEELPDFAAMIASSQVAVSNEVRDAIMESELGPKILYHFAEHPEAAEKLAAMTVSAALRELGRLEAKLEKPAAEAPAAAPPPPALKPKAPVMTPITARTVPDVPVNSAGEFIGTYEEYKALRAAGKL